MERGGRQESFSMYYLKGVNLAIKIELFQTWQCEQCSQNWTNSEVPCQERYYLFFDGNQCRLGSAAYSIQPGQEG